MKTNCTLLVTAGVVGILAVMLISATRPETRSGAAANRASPAQGGLAASLARGKQVYLAQCLACHQADLGGVEGMNPPLIKTKFVLGDKTALVKIVLNGMSGNVDINGDTYHNVMAAHSDLTDLQIADVLTYIRNSFGNKASVVTPAQVKLIRAANKPAGSPASKPPGH